MAQMLCVLLVLLAVSTCSSARLLNDQLHHLELPKAQNKHNVFLPENPSHEEAHHQHVFPCHTVNTDQASSSHLPAAPRFGAAAAAKYGPLVLNLLPKGPTPPSGPSKGTNNLKT
ncbi:hypothetical protein CerSpe_092490 [Prunus speciosa]